MSESGGDVGGGLGTSSRRFPTWLSSLLTFAILLGAYLANGDFLPCSDSVANVYLPVSLITEGDLSFTPAEAPFMFDWRLRQGAAWRDVAVRRWDQPMGGSTMRALRAQGQLELKQPHYYLTHSQEKGRYVNTFGVGTGLALLPFLLPTALALGEDLRLSPAQLWFGAKGVASLWMALSGIFVLWAARGFVPERFAVATALTYGLGTDVWSLGSQALWQQTAALFFLTLGTWFFLRVAEGRAWAMAAGLVLGWAVVCRPTALLVLAPVTLFLLLENRRRGLELLLASLPPGLLLAGYNLWANGSILSFGQTQASDAVATLGTGEAALWSTPLWKGAAGLLLSPSRGLLIYSPIMLLGLIGAILAWRSDGLRQLRPLILGMGLMWLMAFKWFDWWGGWSFGYRPLLDSMGLLALCAAPLLPRLWAHRWSRLPLVLLLCYSVGVQLLGALTYNTHGWNDKAEFTLEVPGRAEPVITHDHDEATRWLETFGGSIQSVQRMNVSEQRFNARLWSWSDSQLRHYAHYPLISREDKHAFMVYWLEYHSGGRLTRRSPGPSAAP